jgi:hypothetical protein
MITFKSSHLKPLNQIEPNLAGIEEISIFCNSSHLEWRAGLSDKILKGTIPARFGLMLLLLKIEMYSIVHCCFSISQNELKF